MNNIGARSEQSDKGDVSYQICDRKARVAKVVLEFDARNYSCLLLRSPILLCILQHRRKWRCSSASKDVVLQGHMFDFGVHLGI